MFLPMYLNLYLRMSLNKENPIEIKDEYNAKTFSLRLPLVISPRILSAYADAYEKKAPVLISEEKTL